MCMVANGLLISPSIILSLTQKLVTLSKKENRLVYNVFSWYTSVGHFSLTLLTFSYLQIDESFGSVSFRHTGLVKPQWCSQSWSCSPSSVRCICIAQSFVHSHSHCYHPQLGVVAFSFLMFWILFWRCYLLLLLWSSYANSSDLLSFLSIPLDYPSKSGMLYKEIQRREICF